MNLKEAFRYQNLLERLMNEATTALSTQANLLKVTKLHLRSKVKPETQDETEEADETDLMDPDLVIAFMKRVITEREQLTTAIGLAKQNLHGSVTDLDAAVEANKYRQAAANRIKSMLRTKDSKRTERGTSYNFNAEGTQVPYVYDIEVSSEVRFDRAAAKKIMQELLAKADKVSAAIDDAMVNTLVAYDAPWDVNESFEDIIAGFQDKGAGGVILPAWARVNSSGLLFWARRNRELDHALAGLQVYFEVLCPSGPNRMLQLAQGLI